MLTLKEVGGLWGVGFWAYCVRTLAPMLREMGAKQRLLSIGGGE